jgi:virulence-associated protein VapD
MLIGGVYTRIGKCLVARQYTRVQGSVYQRENTMAPAAWSHMLALRGLAPLGIFATAAKAVQMFHIPLPIMIVTDSIRLGGAYSPLLIGPTPLNLVPPGVPAVPLVQAPNPLPTGVADNAASRHGPHWAT